MLTLTFEAHWVCMCEHQSNLIVYEIASSLQFQITTVSFQMAKLLYGLGKTEEYCTEFTANFTSSFLPCPYITAPLCKVHDHQMVNQISHGRQKGMSG